MAQIMIAHTPSHDWCTVLKDGVPFAADHALREHDVKTLLRELGHNVIEGHLCNVCGDELVPGEGDECGACFCARHDAKDDY